MSKYFMPPESMQVSPKIIFSPMPGGALTANTQMMRDNNCLDKYDQCIDEMREAVARGGFGTSVTPVSQFYFQQAFSNAMRGKWEVIDKNGYGKMVLGYFGKTPVPPDPEIVELARKQLGLEPTTEAVVDINDRDESLSIKAQVAKLEAANLEVTDENIFIVAACGDKGLNFLKGDRPNGIRYIEEKKAAGKAAGASAYTANVDGKNIVVEVDGNGDTYTAKINGKSFKVSLSEGAAAPAAAASASAGEGKTVAAPLPGTVTKIIAPAGSAVSAGDTILIIEAMKMETEIKADADCEVVEICVETGAVVAAGDALAIVK
jgi:pyruvate carboxylase subunit B